MAVIISRRFSYCPNFATAPARLCRGIAASDENRDIYSEFDNYPDRIWNLR